MQDLNLQIPESSDPVNRRKQLQAFPPNFIHSLDASHMLLSALQCDELGLSFAAVHDSFWTHAADVDVMNTVLRDCFIRIHSEDVIKRLASEFETRYKGSFYLAKVPKGSQIEKNISAFRKGKKMSLIDELLEERERLRLLASSDPEEVKKGQTMQTAASIFEGMSTPQDLSNAEEMEAMTLGTIPDEKEMLADALRSIDENDEDDLASAPEPGQAPEWESSAEIGNMIKQFRTGTAVSFFESELNGSSAKSVMKTKPKAKSQAVINVWLPLTFPEVPQKVS
ncbi:hypothetical protein PC116_g30107 [Phytophthora cactorum]|nr:hypothetical protein PC116_g30107 [Phytophthora cactorum]